MLRNDGYDFLNLGYYLERADNTARLLDVKYYVLLPRADFVGSGLDNYQWTTLLRALSAHRAFHWAYGGDVTAAQDRAFPDPQPRTARARCCTCPAKAERPPRPAGAAPMAARRAAQDRARALLGALAEARRSRTIFDEGLHEFLTRFIREIGALAQHGARQLSQREAAMILTVSHVTHLSLSTARCAAWCKASG